MLLAHPQYAERSSFYALESDEGFAARLNTPHFNDEVTHIVTRDYSGQSEKSRVTDLFQNELITSPGADEL